MKYEAKDLTGQPFGRLTALYTTSERHHGSAVWVCRCDCGAIVSIPAKRLISKETQSCGCLQRERTKLPKNRANLEGQTFGDVKVLGLSSVKNSQTYWTCLCLRCGEEFEALGTRVKSMVITSCGCVEAENRGKIHERIAPYKYEGTNISLIRSDKLYNTNKSGVRGVNWIERDQCWVAQITAQGKRRRKYFGADAFGEAVAWRKRMEEDVFSPLIDAFEREISNS